MWEYGWVYGEEEKGAGLVADLDTKAAGNFFFFFKLI